MIFYPLKPSLMHITQLGDKLDTIAFDFTVFYGKCKAGDKMIPNAKLPTSNLIVFFLFLFRLIK